MDSGDHEFGEDRLREIWQAHGHRPAAQVLDQFFGAVDKFRGRAPQSDDMTVVVMTGRDGA